LPGEQRVEEDAREGGLAAVLGPAHDDHTGGVGWEETVDTAEAQSGGTTASVRGAGEDDRGGARIGVARAPAMSPWFAEGRRQSGASPLLPPTAISSVLQNPLAQFHNPWAGRLVQIL
jgi:hypothetical protein